MTCTTPLRQEHANLTVLDVYDEAALIGKDFERIIESENCIVDLVFEEIVVWIAYGTETIRDLVPKVIRILELLESQAAKNEKETDELLEMKRRVERLEIEKSETRELREKFDRELELIEEQWRKEVSRSYDFRIEHVFVLLGGQSNGTGFEVRRWKSSIAWWSSA